MVFHHPVNKINLRTHPRCATLNLKPFKMWWSKSLFILLRFLLCVWKSRFLKGRKVLIVDSQVKKYRYIYNILAGFMKTAPAGCWRPHTLNWLNWSKYCQETELLPMVLLRWLSSWFLISKRNIQVHQKDTLDLAIHSSCLKALHDRGCLRLKQVLSREFKATSPPPPSPTQRSTYLRGMLS